MGPSNYSDEFKRDAVHQITVRGYPVREVSRRLGVSTYFLYKWLKLFGEPVSNADVDHGAENRRLKRELARGTEKRDIPKKQWRTSRASPNEVRLHPGASRRIRRPGHVPGAAGPFLRLLCLA
ncbi:transposase IS3/IS911 family protein (plasmid) [Dinoroseobacter shibae DFL 12 = DSM 16493]|jgi:transposase|uniref:Transposase IS3/IS911 family protein n=1 Tax=Dinoroseobacter shibae (strain DSM 16493 / NCIMB 14021 / DFL 12) TaxID=398580 RepID=A8LTT0_DINSH|nr:transposase IS3/IS911 family protein [Dinoroseobacter shibae DFL 12 = DSM 16493]